MLEAHRVCRVGGFQNLRALRVDRLAVPEVHRRQRHEADARMPVLLVMPGGQQGQASLIA